MIYDVTISSLTAGTGSSRDEQNDYRVDGTLAVEHNFGILTFSGALKQRKLEVSVYDTEGRKIWDRSLHH
jgi:alkaline phosphatase D